MTKTKTAEIAALNDQFRTGNNPALGRMVITQGIRSLEPVDQWGIMAQVRGFTNFSADNNPHGERDFGALEQAGEKVFWKIDYYNRTLDGGSEDPADPAVTTRVLTIMLASEY